MKQFFFFFFYFGWGTLNSKTIKTEAFSPWIFMQFLFQLVCFINSSIVLTTLLALFNLHDVVNIVDQCDVWSHSQEIQTSSNYTMTEGKGVIIALRQNYKWILFSILHKCRLFLILYLFVMEKNTFAKLVVTYHGLWYKRMVVIHPAEELWSGLLNSKVGDSLGSFFIGFLQGLGWHVVKWYILGSTTPA